MSQPLAGIRVLDISEFGFVPSATAALGDWGGDVIKVERPAGDPLRAHDRMGFGGSTEDFNVLFEHFNRNKRGISLDLADPDGRVVLDRLLETADVVATSFLPRTLDRLRLTPEDVHQHNPRIVYVRGSGQGPWGPDADQPAFDGITWWARGGVAAMLSPPGALARMRPALGDAPTGMMLAGGIAAALFQREQTGSGTVVDASLLAGAVWTLGPDLAATALRQAEPPAIDPNRMTPLLGTYTTRDRRWLQLCMPDERWWAPACHALGLEDLLDDPRYAESTTRAEHHPALRSLFGEAIAGYDLAEAVKRLRERACPHAPMATLGEVLADPQVQSNGYMAAHPDHPTARIPATPVQFGRQPITVRRGAPRLGEHTREVLREAGLPADEIERLLATGAARTDS